MPVMWTALLVGAVPFLASFVRMFVSPQPVLVSGSITWLVSTLPVAGAAAAILFLGPRAIAWLSWTILLSAAFTLRTPVPRDPVHLLARPLAARAAAPAASVADMAEEDVLCQCNGVTKGSVCAAVAGGCGSTAEVSRATRAGTGCGTCRSRIQELLDASRDREPAPV